MRRLLAAPLAALALLAPHAHAASTALVIADPKGDANFSGLHGQTLPAGVAALDIESVTFDTSKTTAYKIVKKKKVAYQVPTGLVLTLKMASPPATFPGASYGITATHSLCGALRLQIYYTPTGPETYGDLASCGVNTDPTSTNPEQAVVTFSPKIEGNNLVIAVPFKLLPKQVKVGTLIDEITAYTSTAEFVYAGYQPTDFEPSAGVDIATAEQPWKIA